MKRCIICLLVLLVFYQSFKFVNAAVSVSLPHPLRKPGGCYSETTGHLKGGTSVILEGKCLRADCLSSGMIGFASCGAILVDDEKCLSEMDPSKPYPDCCPHQIC